MPHIDNKLGSQFLKEKFCINLDIVYDVFGSIAFHYLTHFFLDQGDKCLKFMTNIGMFLLYNIYVI